MMKLHEDKETFRILLSTTSARTGIREDVIEKDYYLTELLRELSDRQDELPAYFKGGTALYKAIGKMIRFSEDIDLTVEGRDCTRSQQKRRLEKAANGYTFLPRTADRLLESNTRGSITSVFDYVPVSVVDRNDALQRFGHVKIEATSFTVSEPFEPMEIAPLLYDAASEQEKRILKAQYGIVPFSIRTISLERIFADKILAAEFYYQRRELIDVSKHLFDLTVMMDMPKIETLLTTPDSLVKMLAYKREEERERIGSDLAELPFSAFKLFSAIPVDERLADAFSEMQRVYVFDSQYLISYERMTQRLAELEEVLLSLGEGLDRQPILSMDSPSF